MRRVRHAQWYRDQEITAAINRYQIDKTMEDIYAATGDAVAAERERASADAQLAVAIGWASA